MSHEPTTPPTPATGQLLPPERLAEIEARHAKGSPSAPWNGEVFDLLGHITALTEQAAGLTLDAGLRECRVEQLTQQLAACENALTERDERVASLTARLAQEGEQEKQLLKRDEEARKMKARLDCFDGHVKHNGMMHPELSNADVAFKVRMLMRMDLDHEMVCVLARNRIIALAAQVADLRAATLPTPGAEGKGFPGGNAAGYEAIRQQLAQRCATCGSAVNGHGECPACEPDKVASHD